jgi:hypothetical protein
MKLKDIPGYEGLYAITRDGEVWTYRRQRVHASWRKSHITHRGYLKVALRKNNVKFQTGVHRLVALTYIPNPKNLPQVNHKDGNKLNNSVENLEWCTQSENQRHSLRIGLRHMPSGENHWRHKSKKNLIGEIA